MIQFRNTTWYLNVAGIDIVRVYGRSQYTVTVKHVYRTKMNIKGLRKYFTHSG